MIEKKYKNLIITCRDWKDRWDTIFTPKALDFFIFLEEKFSPEREHLLSKRKEQQQKLDRGELLDFLKVTEDIRQGDWKAAPIPSVLQDRRVEITGPVDRKMIINGLNSGAKVYMADFEDSQSPKWDHMLDGQINLHDAVRKKIDFQNPDGKQYRLNEKTALLLVRPRGLHLWEKHVTLNGKSVSGSLFDFAFYFFHNAKESINRGVGPYFYIPKLESHQEADLWAQVFAASEEYLKIPKGSIKATVLIETITAVFEMDEIIYALRDYIAGLNCGRWDYIFSFIKKFNKNKNFVLPNREQVGMGVHFLNSYSLLLIKTCHRRGIHAMGGMAAQIPIKNNEEKNRLALDKVRADKEREAQNGHDGTWVAHPGLVKVAEEIFNRIMPGPNQIDKKIDVEVTAADLLKVPEGDITLEGFTNNIKATLHYTAAWISGNGCVPLNNLMEDLATAEIARSQLWQWLHHPSHLADGSQVDYTLYAQVMDRLMKECESPSAHLVASLEYYYTARKLIDEILADEQFLEFLPLKAYELIE